MLRSLVETIIESGLQAIGWVVLKAITLGRYRGFRFSRLARDPIERQCSAVGL
jgi:hypothetical protein